MFHRYQIEVTTRCNFDCWYCTGRQMEQRDMDWEQFTKIVDSIPAGETVMLQGEGEPTLWPHWWRGVEYVVGRQLVPYSIINGSRVDVEKIAKLFPRIGISIDTLDAEEATAIGRHNVSKVLANVEQLAAAMPNRITVHITHVVKDVVPLVRWLAQRGLKYGIQPLQQKQDYQVIYPADRRRANAVVARQRTCAVLENDQHFYAVDGTDLPCVYIKRDIHTFDRDDARTDLRAGAVPHHCQGCSQLR